MTGYATTPVSGAVDATCAGEVWLMSAAIDQLRRDIEREYLTRGDALGWRLLYGPVSTAEHAEVAFIGLNPGGDRDEPDHPSFARPAGSSAYTHERWKGHPPGQETLQRQVRLLCERLEVDPVEVLAGNLVPFRSPTWGHLQNRTQALAFGVKIWRTLLATAQPRLIIAMGREASDHVADLLGLQLEEVKIGWGDLAATRGRGNSLTFVGLPHLSRFRIFGRPASKAALDYLLSDWRSPT